jgi:hypothetical protein
MREEEARLALLQSEINSIQSSIRNFDTIDFQIKGWCVTASLAIGGFAAAYRRPELLIVGIGAVLGFYLVNCHFKITQRKLLDKLERIDFELESVGIIEFLKGTGSFEILGTGFLRYGLSRNARISARVRNSLPDFWFEASRVRTFSLYIFVGVCLIAEIVILLI